MKNTVKEIVYVELPQGSNFDQYSITGVWLNSYTKSKNIKLTRLFIKNGQDLAYFLNYLMSKEVLILLNIWLYDLKLSFFPDFFSRNLDIFTEHSNCYAVIPDHPFATFMYDRVRAASKHVKYRFTDSTQPLVFSQISGFSPRNQLINSMPIPSYDISRLPDYDIRPIDVFVPSNIGHESRFNLSGMERCFLHPLTEAIHTNPYISERNSFQIFAELIKDLKIDIETLFEDDRRRLSAVLLNLGIADNNWRHQFRAKEIEEIAYLNPDLNFVVAGTPRPISSLSNVNFIGFRQFSDICNLIANSRSVLHLHPTYFDGIHERPILAPAFGTPVLTRRMRWTSLLCNRSSLGLYDNPTDFRSVFNGLTSNYDRERADAAICENFLHHGTERFLFDLLSD